MSDNLPFNFRAIETFVAVINTGGMTAAARQLGWSQSAVSQTIMSLERDLKCSLIERNGRRISLTPEGDIFYQQASDILSRARQMMNWIDTRKGGKISCLRVGMVDSFAATAGASLVRQLNGSAEQIKVRSGIAPYLQESFQKGELDLIITMGPLPSIENSASIRILMESYLLATPEDYTPGTAIQLEKICEDMPLIRFSAHTPSGAWTENYLKRFGLRVESSFELDSATTMMAMVREGVGWAMITPLCLAQATEHLQGIRFSSLRAPGYFRELRLVYRVDLAGPIIQKILESTQHTFKDKIFPSLQNHVPWIKEQDFQVTPA